MIAYGSATSHVLQCTQFSWWITSRFFPGRASSGIISYTAAGQKLSQGLPYSTEHLSEHTSVSATCRWWGWSTSCREPASATAVTLSKVYLLSYATFSRLRCSLGESWESFFMCSWSGCACTIDTSPRPPVIIASAWPLISQGSCRAQPSQRGIFCAYLNDAWKLRAL